MSKKETYEQRILSLRVGETTAEEEYITQEHLDEYERFVSKVQEKYSFKTRKQAQSKAQELIKNYQAREREHTL